MLLCVMPLVPAVVTLMLIGALVLLFVALALPLALRSSHCAARGRPQGADADGLGARGGLGLLGASLPKCDPKAREPPRR